MTVEQFAKDFDIFKPLTDWNGCKVWEVSNSWAKGCKTGMPVYVLCKNSTFRYAAPLQARELMRREIGTN